VNCIDVATGTVALTNRLDWRASTQRARFRIEVKRQKQLAASSLQSSGRPHNTTPATYIGCNLDRREPPFTQENGDFIGLVVAHLKSD